MARAKHSFAGPEAASAKMGRYSDFNYPGGPFHPPSALRSVPSVNSIDTAPNPMAAAQVLAPSTVEVRADATNGLAAIFMRTPDGREYEVPISGRKAARMALELLQLASRSLSGLLVPISTLRTVVLGLPKN